MNVIRLSIILAISVVALSSCHKNIIPLEKTLRQDTFLNKVIQDSSFEVQVIYTRVDLKKKKFQSQYLGVDDNRYFYPASTVKMPVAILALQKLNALQKNGQHVLMSDAMLTAQANERLLPAFTDDTQDSGKPSIERYIQKIFAVSDNDAYNRLYEFLGRDYINTELHKHGLNRGTAIRHRLSIPGLSEEDQATFNNVRFFRNKQMIFDKALTKEDEPWLHQASGTQKGQGYLNSQDSLVRKPFDFSMKNYYCLRDMEGTLQRVLFPQFFSPEQRFDLKNEDYNFLRKCMSDLPRSYSFYADTSVYYDSYVKFFLFGDSHTRIPDHLKIYNKVGTAYGYLIDCAYIEDTKEQIGFFLTAVIQVNRDGIFNDNRYEYYSIGLPFLARLGKVIYQAELQAKAKK